MRAVRIVLMTLAFAALAVCLLAQTGVGIQWEWRGGRILERYDGNTKLQFGLHPDGYVMWREVTFETNSPSERLFRRSRMNPQFVPPVTTTNDFIPVQSPTNQLRFLQQPHTNTNLLPPPLPQ